MGSVTVRRIDDEIIRDMRISAAHRGVSMEQEARDRLRRPLPQPVHPDQHERASGSDGEKPKWRLKASMEEILAIGRKLPNMDFDQKAESDRLYDYLDER